MTEPPTAPVSGLERALATLLDLTRQAQRARTAAELSFALVNDSHRLVPYRMAVLWRAGRGIEALSGLVQPEANAPYAQWAQKLCRHLHRTLPPDGQLQALTSLDLPSDLAEPWAEWWPEHALWLPLPPGDPPGAAPTPSVTTSAARAPVAPPAALLLVREDAWAEADQVLLQEWAALWWHAWAALQRQPRRSWLRPWRTDPAAPPVRRWWLRPGPWLLAGMVGLAFVPVRLSVLAPGELVPRSPTVVRAPLDGVIDAFHVQPNEDVAEGQPLFGFDEALIRSRLRVAQQALATANAEYRQIAQQSLVDLRARPQLAALTGRIEERAAEVTFLREQLLRSRVLAPQAGVALFDDPTQWIGKPVVVGERILRIAAPDDVEVEAWLPVGDAIRLAPGTPVRLFLNARPLEPVPATLRFMAHEAVQRPDGSHAYRLRATLSAPDGQRVGLKGTARLEGERVPLAYWVMRRPIATARTWLGL
jgi:multidrug efflux pump subunit AcrA (membrane-fusion protein)